MLFRNREPDRAFEFIARSDFDIFCLQEVPKHFLKRLQTLPGSLAYARDREMLVNRIREEHFLVVLSKHPIETQGDISFADYWPLLPNRTKWFIRLAPSRFFNRLHNRSALFVDLALPSGLMRVFNLHLILANPNIRFGEFEAAMVERDPARPTIVCGDFNILESPHITPLNWIMGGSTSDALLYRRERTRIEQRFMEHELVNTLPGAITHPLSRSQLDHILVSRHFTLDHAEVIPDLYGSDHHPVLANV